MITTRAAVVTAFDEPPHYRSFTLPEPGDDEEVVTVLAAGLHPRVRSGASGAHYTTTGRLPLVPGVDGVGRRADGSLVYFALDDDRYGSMAASAVIDSRRSISLPDDADVMKIASAMNPAMSSWVALRRRIQMPPGASVLVLGATGNAGTMAVTIARLLGAHHVVAAGRNPERLEVLNGVADRTIALTGDAQATDSALADAAADVDVVLDYVWGDTTERAIPALLTARTDRSRPLDWIEIGSASGPNITLPSAALRSAHLRLIGSGQGSIGARDYLGELPSLVQAIMEGRIPVSTRAVPLADVEEAWALPDEPGVRTVLVP
jgi:NADPH:quinone reductase-like Zn-dependent oxidoreductase